MFAYGVGPCARGRPGHRAGQHLHGHRQAAAQGPWSASTPRPGPTEIAILADDTADPAYVAADLISQAEHDPLAAVGAGHRRRERSPTRSRPSSTTQVAATKHTERIRTALAGAAVRASCWSTTWSRASRSSTRTPPSTWRSRPPTPRRRGRGCATPARSSSARTRRSRSATTAPAPTTCCPPAAAPATPPGCRCARSQAVHVVDYARDGAGRGGRPRRDAGRGRGPARPRRGGPACRFAASLSR